MSFSVCRSAFKFARVPVTVSDAELLEPDVIFNPEVEPNLSTPCETLKESESEVPDAALSVKLIALPLAVEKVSELFSLRKAAAGAVMVGPGWEIANVTGPPEALA